ncbi:MAG: sulfite exporter TauE/SafE family protein [Vulcanococcus sp.]
MRVRRAACAMGWELLPLLPLGILAGLLSGLLGIGGGLVFSPLLLWIGLPPHQALATSTLAIVPTTMAGSLTHWRSGQVPAQAALAISAGAAFGGGLFSRLGHSLEGWQLLALQALMYGLLALVIEPRRTGGNSASTVPVLGLIGVGLVAGLSSGLLGVGGGLVMVPLMVRGLRLGVYQAIRLSTMAVFASSLVASFTFWGDGRAQLLIGLVLGATAASAAQWSAGHLQKVPEQHLVGLIRLLCVLLAVDVGRRAVLLWL